MRELSLKGMNGWVRVRWDREWVRKRGNREGRGTEPTHRRNSGVALYFSNSLSHSASESGGRTPVMGRHSVMLNPDSVRRVTPPTTMTAKTSVEERKSQFATAGVESTGRGCRASDCQCAPPFDPFDEKKRGGSGCLSTDLPVGGTVGPVGELEKSLEKWEERCSLVRERVEIGVQFGGVCVKRSSGCDAR